MPSSGFQTCARSEEHTSELQSHSHLVCRLLLEKKQTPEQHVIRTLLTARHPLRLLLRAQSASNPCDSCCIPSHSDFGAPPGCLFFFLKEGAPPGFPLFPHPAPLPF